jgi:hypothetical protein
LKWIPRHQFQPHSAADRLSETRSIGIRSQILERSSGTSASSHK